MQSFRQENAILAALLLLVIIDKKVPAQHLIKYHRKRNQKGHGIPVGHVPQVHPRQILLPPELLSRDEKSVSRSEPTVIPISIQNHEGNPQLIPKIHI